MKPSEEMSQGVASIKKGQSASRINLYQKLEKQRFLCAMTGWNLTPETATIDHIVPLADGGTDEIENLMWVAWDVNRSKGTMSRERFVEVCQAVATFSNQDGGGGEKVL